MMDTEVIVGNIGHRFNRIVKIILPRFAILVQVVCFVTMIDSPLIGGAPGDHPCQAAGSPGSSKLTFIQV